MTAPQTDPSDREAADPATAVHPDAPEPQARAQAVSAVDETTPGDEALTEIVIRSGKAHVAALSDPDGVFAAEVRQFFREDFPRLVKSLRSAREENATLRGWIVAADAVLSAALGDRYDPAGMPVDGVRQLVDLLGEAQAGWNRAERERDEARAEGDLLASQRDAVIALCDRGGPVPDGKVKLLDVAEVYAAYTTVPSDTPTLRQERDEARAELERVTNLARASDEAHRAEIRRIVADHEAELEQLLKRYQVGIPVFGEVEICAAHECPRVLCECPPAEEGTDRGN